MLAIIGGTGLTSIDELDIIERKNLSTPYGEPSSAIIMGQLADQPIYFLARHGVNHDIPPHKVNYRANIAALKSLGIDQIIAVNAVGGINEKMGAGHITLVDQIIDYTHDRAHTFFEEDNVHHIDFTYPYSEIMRSHLIEAAKRLARQDSEFAFSANGVYGCTQGPRLETAAEVNRLERDGCDVVGMTAMPEAALARELEIDYVGISLVVNVAAGRSAGIISMAEIEKTLASGMIQVRALLKAYLVDNALPSSN